jgi:hypothetical protein
MNWKTDEAKTLAKKGGGALPFLQGRLLSICRFLAVPPVPFTPWFSPSG